MYGEYHACTERGRGGIQPQSPQSSPHDCALCWVPDMPVGGCETQKTWSNTKPKSSLSRAYQPIRRDDRAMQLLELDGGWGGNLHPVIPAKHRIASANQHPISIRSACGYGCSELLSG